ncbi:DUF2167 domain-containing protein [Brevundimonas sp.]|uniref:DUF2167 domain-containing protein n=1 Tax=Brevundimonas sp. TaxID=1871086 RepID=UPI002D5F4009|nr:DUF2167 domain-containing protein [Brevundimonas sp.]HYC68093.1 DUF2167 domain-containing protein [Brevundimonas sp.]
MIRKAFAALLLALGFLTAMPAAASPAAAPPTAEQQAELRRLEALLESLDPQGGEITLPAAKATLSLGEDYYFLGADDARRVLIDAWGNPPSVVDGVLGMVFPAGKSPLDDTWGAVITYLGDGYVSDADAASIDYADLLRQLKAGEEEQNRALAAEGYPASTIVGWAQQPSYDAARHNLIWAKNIAFADSSDNTLNYDVRVLGREGVLSMNIVAQMSDLAAIGPEASKLMNTASFQPGAQYADYREGVDKKAAYGVGGLIAGGAALAVAKKVGLLGILFLVLKKGWIVLAIGGAAAWRWLSTLFGGKKGGEFSSAARASYEPGGLGGDPAAAAVPAESEPGEAPEPGADGEPRT